MHFQQDTIFDFPLVSLHIQNGELECDDSSLKQMLQFLFDRVDDLQMRIDEMNETKERIGEIDKEKRKKRTTETETNYRMKRSKKISKLKGSNQIPFHSSYSLIPSALPNLFDDIHLKEVDLVQRDRKLMIASLLDDIENNFLPINKSSDNCTLINL
ncbi:hypothetical protein QTN25_000379 [Entamoeba marina]